MQNDFERIDKARTVLQKLAKGINPLNGEQVEKDSILNDPKIIRCFYFISEVLDNVMSGAYSNSRNKFLKFSITPEQKNKVVFPEGNIGVNEFSRCINLCIDPAKSKSLTGVELNKRLRKMGVLSGETTADGKIRTVVNGNSAQYGLEAENRTFKGAEYVAVVINDTGKKYLLENLETIMEQGE